MPSIGTLTVDVETNTSKLAKGAKVAAGALALIGAAAFKAVKSASSLEEAVSASNTTFGAAGKQVLGWSKNTKDAFSQVDFLTAAKTFAGFGKAAGLAEKDTAGFSKGLIDAAQDMASFHDADPTQVLEDIRSGLAGEVEPLRKYQIMLSQAALEQQGVKMGLIEMGGTMTEEQKILARQAFILDNLGDATGDWGRTIGSAANQERIAASNSADLTAQLGQALLPAYKALVAIGIRVVSFLGRHQTLVKVLAGTLAGLATVVLLAAGAWKVYVAVQRLATIATKVTNAALRVQRILLMTSIIGALILLGVAVVLAYRKWETFRNVVRGVLNAVVGASRAAVDFIRRHWQTIIMVLTGPVGVAIVGVIRNFDRLRDAGVRVASVIRSAVMGMVGAIRTLVGWISTAVSYIARLAGAIRSLPSLPDISPGFDIPGVPGLQHGGIVRRPTLAMVGEAGPEAVVPLDRLGAGGGGTLILEVDGTTLGRVVVDQLARYERRNGPLPLRIR